MRFYEVVPTAILKHRTVPRRSQHKPLPTFALVMAARLFFLAACLFCLSSAFSIAVPSSQLAVSTRAMSPVVMGAKAPPKKPVAAKKAPPKPAAKKAAPKPAAKKPVATKGVVKPTAQRKVDPAVEAYKKSIKAKAAKEKAQKAARKNQPFQPDPNPNIVKKLFSLSLVGGGQGTKGVPPAYEFKIFSGL
jgi:outer membrane biosynthesis protein TonB